MHAAELLTSRARLTPDREGLFEVATGRRYTFAELNTRACRCANLLRSMGVRKGDRVSILAHNGVAYLDLLYGLAKIGAIFAPFNWRLTARELTYIANDCGPDVILCGPEFAATLAEMLPAIPPARVLGLDGAHIACAERYEAALAAAPADEPEAPSLSGEEPLCLLYTSGTTGRPKGALLPHRQIVWNCVNTVISWGLTEKDVSPVFTPLFHAGGLFAFLTPMLYVGGRIVLTRGFDAEQTLRLIQDEGCTAILGVPTLFQVWQNHPAYAQADFGRVRFFINGGAPCPPAVMEHWRASKGVTFRQGYGLTEVGTNCFSMTDEESVPKTGSVGKPIFHMRARLIDPETGADTPTGQVGELLFNGPTVCLGYWHNPTATDEAFWTDERGEQWFRTGDGARMDADGFFYIQGRFKDMIKSGGENVYAAEVEAVIREHAAVADAALIGQPDAKWGEIGLIVVTLKPGATATADDILRHCDGRLARFKIPKRVEFADALPYSPYGKVVKAELRQIYLRS